MKGDRNILTPNYIIGESIIGKADNAKATGGHTDNACEAKELDAEIEELRSKYREILRAERESLRNNTANSDSDRARQRAGQTRVHGQTIVVVVFWTLFLLIFFMCISGAGLEISDAVFEMLFLFVTTGFGLLLMLSYNEKKKHKMERSYKSVVKEQSQFYGNEDSFAFKSMIISNPEYILTHQSTEI
jgi:hypothetical protein